MGILNLKRIFTHFYYKKDQETQFLEKLLELQYSQDVSSELQKISSHIPWAKGWPEHAPAFWNAEAFMWEHKIESKKRYLIRQELRFLSGKKNLDIGCGSYSYIPSVGIDFSEKMLQFNDRCSEKIPADLEQKLPLSENSFDSVTAVFVLNYINNYVFLLKEIKRVLKATGTAVVVLYAGKLNPWQRQKEVNSFSFQEWKDIFERHGFQVDFSQKEDLWFFRCVKRDFSQNLIKPKTISIVQVMRCLVHLIVLRS